MTTLVDLLTQALAIAQGTLPGTDAPPAPPSYPGYVAVRPTGVLAHGVVRWYPEPNPFESLFTYASRIQMTVAPDTGHTYLPSWMFGTAIFSPSMGPPPPYPGANDAECFDFVMHARDWWSQAEVERQASLPGGAFSPGP